MANQFTNSGSTINKNQGLFSQIGSIFGSKRNTQSPVIQPNVVQSILGKPATQSMVAPQPVQMSPVKPTVTTKPTVTPTVTKAPTQTGVVKAPVSQYSAPTTNTATKTIDTTPNTGMINLGNTQPQPKPYVNDQNLFGNVVTGLANTPVDNKEVNEALKNREALQNEYQKSKNLIQSRGWDLSEQGGAQGMLTSSFNTASAAAEDRVQNALTAQQNQINALNNAGNLAKPVLGAVTNVPFNPISGTQGKILGSGDSNDLSEAGKIMGRFQGAQNTAENQYTQTEVYKSAHQQAQNLQSQLTDLIGSMGLNPSDLAVANQGLQFIAKNISDSRYKILENYLTDVASRYAQILTPTGGSQTDTVRNTAQGMINGIASGNSIINVLNSLDQQAQAVSAGVNTNNTGNVQGANVPTSSGSITPRGGLSF